VRLGSKVSAVLALWLLLAGCGGSSEAVKEETTAPETATTESPKLIRLTDDLDDPRRGAPTFTVSPDGKKVAFGSVSTQDDNPGIYVVGSDGTGLTNNLASGGNPIWSPDGKKILFGSSREGNPEIYIMDSDGSNQTNLTNNPGRSDVPGTPFDGGAVFSPEGGEIAFVNSRDGNHEIYMMNSDSTSQTNRTNDPGSADTDPAFSLDGKKIVFRKCPLRGGTCHFYVMSSDGTNQILAANDVGARTPFLSPDGEKLAFRHPDQAGSLKIYLTDVDRFNPISLTDQLGTFVSHPVFLPDGRIAFVSNPAHDDEIYTINQDGTGQTNLTNDPTANDGGGGDKGPSFSADGKKMAFLKAHYDESGNYISEIYLMNLQ
jgi:Tol biopolymer transport system component